MVDAAIAVTLIVALSLSAAVVAFTVWCFTRYPGAPSAQVRDSENVTIVQYPRLSYGAMAGIETAHGAIDNAQAALEHLAAALDGRHADGRAGADALAAAREWLEVGGLVLELTRAGRWSPRDGTARAVREWAERRDGGGAF